MSWLFLIAGLAAGIFMLPGGGRSPADRRLAQGTFFLCMAAALFAFGLKPIGAAVLLIGIVLFGIGWFRAKLLGEGFQDLEENIREKMRPMTRRPLGQEMTRQEALDVLGLRDGADEPQIVAAHRRMIARAHPDSGGSDYMAAKVNLARDILLR